MAESVVANPQNSTLILNGEPIRDFIEGEKIILTFPNPLTSRKNSENGGVSIAKTVNGDVGQLVIKVQKRSDSDKFLTVVRNGDVTVLNGSLKTRLTNDGVDGVDSYTLISGTITDQPADTQSNLELNNEMEYTIEFRSVIRNI